MYRTEMTFRILYRGLPHQPREIHIENVALDKACSDMTESRYRGAQANHARGRRQDAASDGGSGCAGQLTYRCFWEVLAKAQISACLAHTTSPLSPRLL